MTDKEKVKDILRELRLAVKTESALIKRDGRLILSDFSYGFHANEVFGSMSSVIVGAAKNIAMECRKGPPKKVIILTGDAHIILTNAGSKALLMCVTDEIKDMDRLIFEIDSAAERLKLLT